MAIATPIFGSLGLLLQVLRAMGWDITLWSETAQQKIGFSTCGG